MKGILVLGVIAALAVAPGGSVDCPQCSSFDDPCDGSVVSECPADANTSCLASYAGWPAASPPTRFYDKACSAINCSDLATAGSEASISFYVRVAAGQTAWLESQCCNGGPCSSTSPPPTPDIPTLESGNTQCTSCIGVNGTSCDEIELPCNPRERCVDVVAEVVPGTRDTENFTLTVKGCSDITDDLCQLLSTPDTRIGNIAFQQLSCRDAAQIPSSLNSGGALAAAPWAITISVALGLLRLL